MTNRASRIFCSWKCTWNKDNSDCRILGNDLNPRAVLTNVCSPNPLALAVLFCCVHLTRPFPPDLSRPHFVTNKRVKHINTRKTYLFDLSNCLIAPLLSPSQVLSETRLSPLPPCLFAVGSVRPCLRWCFFCLACSASTYLSSTCSTVSSSMVHLHVPFIFSICSIPGSDIVTLLYGYLSDRY